MPTPKILIIDDEPSILKFLDLALQSQDFHVQTANSGQAGLIAFQKNSPDVVILDLGLGDRSGHDVLSDIRKRCHVPVIILSVQDREEEKVKAFELGADDYLTKPFGIKELIARIRVALRHAQIGPIYQVGPLVIDDSSHLVRVRDIEVRLTVTEYQLLKVLMKNAGKVVTHQTLLKEVWGPESVEHTQYLRVYMGQIRKKLQVVDNLPEFILTELGVGYRLLLQDEG
jgi:two-component system KDP operon response regulator KdpE